MSSDNGLLVPEGARLIHIGPHKTGSTAVQVAMHEAREQLAAHGVHYAGGGVRPKKAGWSIGIMGRPAGSERPPERHWLALVEEVEAAGTQRVCISDEDFGRADPEQRVRVVADLGGDRAHVVAVARRLDRYLPSQWQERVKAGDTRSYEEWLRVILDPSPTPLWDRLNVWRAHDTHRLVRNWADVVGEERFTLIIGDESDRMQLPRTFEQLLGLPEQTLELHPDRSNRGLSWAETELVRAVNIAVGDQWSRPDRTRLVKAGVIKALMSRPSTTSGPRTPPLPAWAADEVRRLSDERADAIAALGVRLVGNPDDMRVPDDVEIAGPGTSRPDVDQETAAVAVAAIATASFAAGRRQQRLRQQQLRQQQRREASQPPDAPKGEEVSLRSRVGDAARGARSLLGRREPRADND